MAKPFVVATDASSQALGAVLSQHDEDGREHPVQYASRCLTPAERNYSTFEREALAVVFAFKKFRPFLLSNRVTLLTDHQALQHTFNNKEPHGRVARWLCFLAVYDFEVQYRRGKSNGNADFARAALVLTMVMTPTRMAPRLHSLRLWLSKNPSSRS